MKIVIIEDELYAAKRLETLISEYNKDFKVLGWLESVHDSVAWFRHNAQPDLIFLDIHLEDDLSFRIFDQITVSCPIVFTTATDELAIKAFQTLNIDFLHKPIVQTELNQLLTKYSNPHNYPVRPIGPGFFRELINRKV